MTLRKVESTVSSKKINLLVFHYLQESGFVHTAFMFGKESQLADSDIENSQISPFALKSFVERGINFAETEETLNDNKNPGQPPSVLDRVLSKFEVHRCLCRNDDEKSANNLTANSVEVHYSDVLLLKGHSAEVFMCTWNPKASILATGSGDATASIWSIPGILHSPSTAVAAYASKPLVLQHADKRGKSLQQKHGSNEVTSLDWNSSGTLLATGSNDGRARIWSHNGTLKHTFVKHEGPLLSIKWNKDGEYVVAGSADHATSIWSAESGRCVRHFKFHDGPILAVDWKDDKTFASCSTDKRIYMCSLESNYPEQILEGHDDEINCLKFSASGTLLASCSDDGTVKVWSSRTSTTVRNLRGHLREVNKLEWCPRASERPILASASFDATIKLWDVKSGSCMKTLAGHTEPVYCLAYSPNGQYLASGSFDRCVNIWNAEDGTLLKRFRGDGSVYDVAWSPVGNKVSAAFKSNTVAVIDLQEMQGSTFRSQT